MIRRRETPAVTAVLPDAALDPLEPLGPTIPRAALQLQQAHKAADRDERAIRLMAAALGFATTLFAAFCLATGALSHG